MMHLEMTCQQIVPKSSRRKEPPTSIVRFAISAGIPLVAWMSITRLVVDVAEVLQVDNPPPMLPPSRRHQDQWTRHGLKEPSLSGSLQGDAGSKWDIPSGRKSDSCRARSASTGSIFAPRLSSFRLVGGPGGSEKFERYGMQANTSQVDRGENEGGQEVTESVAGREGGKEGGIK